MPSPHVAIPGPPGDVRAALAGLQARVGLSPAFPATVLEQAAEAARRVPVSYVDRTDVELVTVDPASSTDLDQALQIERAGSGYLVRYAISDVAHFVQPGTALEAETHRRGLTMYAPDARIPLHPAILSEGAASLLADGGDRPAMLWELRLDAEGRTTDVALTRALVRSRAKLSYQGVEKALSQGRPHRSIALLPEVGRLRQRVEEERGGVSLNLPSQEIVDSGGSWALVHRRLSPIEDWNAQISLLTGFAAAAVMIAGKVGVLRTLPPTQPADVSELRGSVVALGVPWPEHMSYPHFVKTLSPADPKHLAALSRCTRLFRGADYSCFDGELPTGGIGHGALASPYAHTTAPLRRLVDRYVLEICHSLLNGLPVPEWVREAMPALPGEMRDASRRARQYESGVLDIAEALVLCHRIGDRLEAVVTGVSAGTGELLIQVAEPALEVRVKAPAGLSEAGDRVEVVVESVEADLTGTTLTLA